MKTKNLTVMPALYNCTLFKEKLRRKHSCTYRYKNSR